MMTVIFGYSHFKGIRWRLFWQARVLWRIALLLIFFCLNLIVFLTFLFHVVQFRIPPLDHPAQEEVIFTAIFIPAHFIQKNWPSYRDSDGVWKTLWYDEQMCWCQKTFVIQMHNSSCRKILVLVCCLKARDILTSPSASLVFILNFSPNNILYLLTSSHLTNQHWNVLKISSFHHKYHISPAKGSFTEHSSHFMLVIMV